MKTPYMQFNRQKVAALLLAGLILAAGLTWVRVAAQPTPTVGQPWAYLNVVKGSKLGGSTEGVSARGSAGELRPWTQFRFITGSKPGTSSGSGLRR
ncbi:MAG: hypothetical protein U0401_05785 [Anaerolineae bacterium]